MRDARHLFPERCCREAEILRWGGAGDCSWTHAAVKVCRVTVFADVVRQRERVTDVAVGDLRLQGERNGEFRSGIGEAEAQLPPSSRAGCLCAASPAVSNQMTDHWCPI